MIPYGKQHITDDDIRAVTEALQQDFLTQGPAIAAFETAFATYTGAAFAVAVSNGTAALHLSCIALGVTEGSKVITTPITFAASANCVRYCGGEVVFADIDPRTYLIDPAAVRKLLETHPKGTFSGIIPVDFAGRPVNTKQLRELADEFGLWILEDACHAPGAFFRENGRQYVSGDGSSSELSVFSFHPVKHIACGEGGMITTNDERLYQQLLALRTHGITRDHAGFKNSVALSGGMENYPGWYMEMQELGFNYRLTDIQAALGNSQLKRADEGLERRRELAAAYADFFSGKPYISGHSGAIEGHAYHLYVIETEQRLELYDFLRTKAIFCQVHYIPCHLMPYYRELGWKPGDFPHAEQYYSRCLSIPMFPTLTDEEQQFVMDTIDSFFA